MMATVLFRMQKGSEVERVEFGDTIKFTTPKDIDNYFEEQCGGVYKWWHEGQVEPIVASEVKDNDCEIDF